MPDGARFERGGEFIEAGYDAFPPPRGRVRPAARATGIRVRRARGAIRRADAARRCCSRPSGSSPRRSTRSARTPPHTSAADALARTPLEPLARRALRAGGSRGRTRWSSTASRRPGSRAPSCGRSRRQPRLPRAWPTATTPWRRRWPPSSASACGSAVPVARSCSVSARGLRSRRTGSPASASPSTGCCRPCASARATGGCSGASPRSCTCRSPSRPPPGAVQALDAAFWTWTAGAGGAPTTSPPRSRAALDAHRVARDPDRPRALARRPPGAAARAGPARQSGAHELAGRRSLVRRLVRLPSAGMVAARRRGGRSALRPHPPGGRAHGGRVLRNDGRRAAQRRSGGRRGARRALRIDG